MGKIAIDFGMVSGSEIANVFEGKHLSNRITSYFINNIQDIEELRKLINCIKKGEISASINICGVDTIEVEPNTPAQNRYLERLRRARALLAICSRVTEGKEMPVYSRKPKNKNRGFELEH